MENNACKRIMGNCQTFTRAFGQRPTSDTRGSARTKAASLGQLRTQDARRANADPL